MVIPGLKKYLPLAALVFLCSGPAAASFVLGSQELLRLTGGSSGGLTNGDKTLFFSNEPEVYAAPLLAGGAEVKVGFYSELAKERWAWLASEFEVWRFPAVTGQLIGISTGMSAPVLFNRTISTDTLSTMRITRISDRTGQSLNENIAFSTASYDPVNYRFELLPSTGSWEYNSIYSVSLGTGVLSEEGVPVNSFDFNFVTRYKYYGDTVVRPIQGNDTSVEIAQDVFSNDGYLQIDTAPVFGLFSSADSAFTSEYSGGPDSVTGIDYCSSLGSPGVCAKEPRDFSYGAMLVTLPYSPAAIPNPMVYVLNETTARWEPLPTAEKTSTTVSAYAPHFSFFMVGGSVISSLSLAKVYPSPFRPSGPAAGTGAGKTGTDAGGITFVVPNASRVTVYTARGELVWEGANPAGGSIVWDTRSKGGNKAASGVYLYLIKSPVGSQTGKLAIIR